MLNARLSVQALCLSVGVVASSAQAATVTPADKARKAEEAVRAKIVGRLDCRGTLSRIDVYRSDKGVAKVYVAFGDFRACSHAPTQIFDTKGKQVANFGEHPVGPGEVVPPKKTVPFWVRGLTLGETLWPFASPPSPPASSPSPSPAPAP